MKMKPSEAVVETGQLYINRTYPSLRSLILILDVNARSNVAVVFWILQNRVSELSLADAINFYYELL